MMMRIVGQLAVVLVLGAATAAGWYVKDDLPWAGGGAAAVRNPAAVRVIPVQVAAARRGDVMATVEAVGTVRANEAVAITPKVAGLVSRIAFQDGQKVTAGTVLIELDAGELQARLAESRATRDNAQQLLRRAEQLLASRNVPQARVDELQAQLAAAEARVRANAAMLEDFTVRAPFAGRLGLRQISLGALVRPGDVITTLDDTSVVKLEFEVPEVHLASIAPGLQVDARSPAFAERSFTGRVTAIDTRLDPATRTIRVRAVVPNSDETLKPGMFLNVGLIVGRRPDAVLVPEEAVIASSLGTHVFVVRDGRASRSRVTLGQRQKGVVEVVDGVAAGDQVIVGGVQQVRDGAAVTAAPAAPAGES